jgi:D-arabinose 5-phosphate isomerase GutQ
MVDFSAYNSKINAGAVRSPLASTKPNWVCFSTRFNPRQISRFTANDQSTKATSVLSMGSLFELVMFVFGEMTILELLRRTGKSVGKVRDRHTNLE